MNNTTEHGWFASCPKGLEALLAHELSTLGAESTRETVAGVYFDGALATGYRACLWSRLANRILMPLGRYEVADADALYAQLQTIAWDNYFGVEQSFAIDFSGQSQEIRNTQFGAQRSKDAIVDWFRSATGQRPSVQKRDPDIRINIRLAKSRIVVALDFSGGSLHRRGYRLQSGEAPLKENLAAAILLRADWPAMAARGGALIDPMCGSATLLLEAAMMSADIAPGLARERFGFEAWKGHNKAQWAAIFQDAAGRAQRGRAAQLPEIRGYDADPVVIRRAQENIARIGLEKVVRVSCKPLAELQKPSHMPLPLGLIICNPPYGERMGEKESLRYLYRQLGEVMLREFSGWQGAVFTADVELGKATGLRSYKRYALYNGALPSSLLLFDLANNQIRGSKPGAEDSTVAGGELSDGAKMFANRIRKNKKRLSRWVKRENIQCYRLYDADMPEYAVAVDVYGENLHVAEYQAPKEVDEEAASRRMAEVVAALPEALAIAPEAISYKRRQRQRGLRQYEKEDSRGELNSVREGQARLLVNLHDYLDTGLFLDHRPLRLRIAKEASGQDFLNLFCYTGAATIHAALGGARSTTSVDMSNTYLGWLRKNLAHNGLGETGNLMVKANCIEWLAQAEQKYDLIMLDPPSFSNSKSMDDSFDIQRDHLSLIEATMAILRPGGTLYFSTNRRSFKLDDSLPQLLRCEDISRETLDPDFQRNAKIHKCWRIQHATD
ncbi:MAG: bifunctional 23S rRNA (guanine(2069)-N(7))-methyltransferase RlmK/23S rRNA (guanine(2445)-N(2))-methyltransferase RlmL [Proteobacteria bacterium]|nr:bifunctional 23S rRNA (guanine(2069)-N(7))-methyltransferase RlmK/23S rRNA (guanine(2445)-N(2))-methyltransferase RlmL [Pseudomonadota bacterium]